MAHRTHGTWIVCLAAACLAGPGLAGARPGDAERLKGVLASEKPWRQKEAAVVALRGKGGAELVPVLAPLLADAKLSHAARHVLEPMPAPAAGEALLGALDATSGAVRAGIIDSLGDRRETKATGALARLLADPDPMIASGAATALGKIGGPNARDALRKAWPQARPAVRCSVADALLAEAERLGRAGSGTEAAALCRELCDSARAAHVRTAAFRGLLLAAGAEAAAVAATALQGDDEPARLAVQRLVHEDAGRPLVAALLPRLGELPPPVQVSLLSAPAASGRSALAAVRKAARSPSAAVRIAAARALARIGDASAVSVLVDALASSAPGERGAVRAALIAMRGEGIGRALLTGLDKAQPKAQAALVEVLAARREKQAVPRLRTLARVGQGPVRPACVRALAALVDSVDGLLDLLPAASSEADREGLVQALAAVGGKGSREDAAGKVLAARQGADVPTRCALLRAAGLIGGTRALAALRSGLGDPSPAVRDAAVRTLAEAGPVEAAPDLLALARDGQSPTHRVLAMRGYWRVVGLAAERPAAERLALCTQGLAVARRAEDKRLGLAELARIPHTDALAGAEAAAKDKAVAAEAQAACVQIASALSASHPNEAKAALRRIIAAPAVPRLADEARKALDAIERHGGYVRTWQVAGPYRVKGKTAQQLFDVTFAPEQPGGKAAWRQVALPAEARAEHSVDLAKVVGGDHCVVYLRARAYSPKAQPVRLEIGADDGVKMWINGTLVHANNAVRGLTPAEDKAGAALRQGWNDLLVKITQHTLGCGAVVRFRTPAGRTPEGLQFDNAAAATR